MYTYTSTYTYTYLPTYLLYSTGDTGAAVTLPTLLIRIRTPTSLLYSTGDAGAVGNYVSTFTLHYSEFIELIALD